jgi:hypothetical protein
MTSDDSAADGFAKPGTTLEGRVAQLLRLMGYNVARNQIIEGHEIDVYGEKEGRKIVVECKEYYTGLVDREKILIFSAKVRDIRPEEAWFVTISDFDQSSFELCKRYGIRAINGYDLEELEDEAIAKKGQVAPGQLPPEDRYLRLLERRRTELSREKRRFEEIGRVAEQVNSLRRQQIALPPFLFPTTARDLEERYIWLHELEEMPKTCEDGTVKDIVVNLGSQPRIKGFEVTKVSKYSLAAVIALAVLGINLLAMYYFEPWLFDPRRRIDNLSLLIIPRLSPTIIVAIATVVLRRSLVYRRTSRSVRSAFETQFVNNMLYLPSGSRSLVDDPFDMSSQRLHYFGMNLVDGADIGHPINYVIERSTWLIQGIQVRLSPEISKDTGHEEIIIPVTNAEFDVSEKLSRIKVNAVYVLGDTFLKEKKMS